MKRRNFLKSVGAGALPLAGLERLVRAMVSPKAITAPVECPKEEALFNCKGSQPYRCDNFNCAVKKDQNFVCNSTDPNENFLCNASFHGCKDLGDFNCQGTDPRIAQFECYNEFSGCDGLGSFRCYDFKCDVNYKCGDSNTCPRYPFYCANPYTA